MIVDVLYRAGDRLRHGWRVMVRTNAPTYIVTAWGEPERFGLTRERAETEATFAYLSKGDGNRAARPTCARVIVIVWDRFMKERHITVGYCRHKEPCRRAILEKAS